MFLLLLFSRYRYAPHIQVACGVALVVVGIVTSGPVLVVLGVVTIGLGIVSAIRRSHRGAAAAQTGARGGIE